MPIGATWCSSVELGVVWCKLVHFVQHVGDSTWCTLVNLGADWVNVVQLGVIWCNLVLIEAT